jgi:predicted PurR-regulated permease PerM
MEPLVVGSKVNLHPLFTILGLVAGEFIWGIPGMILAIPIMGMSKIIFDHIDSLKSFGYLIGEERKSKEDGIMNKIKKAVGKKAKS